MDVASGMRVGSAAHAESAMQIESALLQDVVRADGNASLDAAPAARTVAIVAAFATRPNVVVAGIGASLARRERSFSLLCELNGGGAQFLDMAPSRKYQMDESRKKARLYPDDG